MLVFSISDFTQNATQVLNAALNDEVIINNEGRKFKILPIKDEKTDVLPNTNPLENIPYITANITTQEIVELIRENRAGV